MRRGYARGRARDEAIRAELRPLAAGERPLALKLDSALALLIAVANVAVLLAGWEVDGKRPVTGALAFAAVMVAAAAGIWQRWYPAVLAFQILLGLSAAYAMLSLLLAGNVVAVLLCLVVMGVAGWLFWKNVRLMARMQAPRIQGGRR
jgi:hypothetical protein